MSRLRALWFESRHLESGAPGLHAALAALDPAARAELLETGDRLAATSLTLAQQYCRRAPAAWRLGAGAFRAWVARGERLALAESGSRAAALAYFGLEPARLLAVPAADLDLWIDLAVRVLGTSRRMGEVFVAESGPILAELGDLDGPEARQEWKAGGEPGAAPTRGDRPSAAGRPVATAPEGGGGRRRERLTRWVEEGLRLVGAESWEAELLAMHFFEATALAMPLFAPADYGVWAAVARAAARLGGARPELFASVPTAAHALPEDDRGAALRTAHAAAAAPAVALELYFSLPGVLEALPAGERAALLAALQPVAAEAPRSLRELLPVLRAILQATPPDVRPELLAHARAVAERFPEGAVPFFRVLPRLLERTGAEGVARWASRGLEVAAESAAAGRAYFGLDSRTSRAVLATESTAVEFAEVASLMRRYLHMLTGRTWHVAADALVMYRPPFASPAPDPADTLEALFPLRADVFPTAEANLRLFRLIAAQHAGRAEFGTDTLDPSVDAFLASFDHREIATELLAIFEGIRVDAAVGRAYRGLAADLQALAVECAHGGLRLPGTVEHFATVLRHARRSDVARSVAALGERLAAPDATAADSAAATRAVYAELMRGDFVQLVSADPAGFADMLAESEVIDARLELGDAEEGAGGAPVSAEGEPDGAAVVERPGAPVALGEEDDAAPGGAPLDPAELLRLLKEGAELSIKQGGGGEHVEALGLYISDLAGKIPRERLQELQADLRRHAGLGSGRATAPPAAGDGAFVYDEWDHTIGDYRHAWCRLAEIPLASDTGDFFAQTLATHAELLPEVRRQFQRIRPERYRVVHGLEDGEDFDLNAVIDARADRRAGHAPSPKVYQRRQREERDVATLFLIDMSASTDEPVPDAPGRRVIDITKEALVVMTEALEEIGDAYGIYGFSGHGRQQVEIYLVKHFAESLTPAVKGRIGAIEPRRSTRMGTALRHAVARLRKVGARSRHVILLSDGFPQDLDYGDDRRSNAYGIQDTAMAFQEAMRAGVLPFCITVDKAGHDYLKDICESSRYLVIDDITALPRELPKIYQRFVRP